MTDKKNIVIDKNKLIQWLIDNCYHLANYNMSDKKYCELLSDKNCKRAGVLRYECPSDCPHICNVNTECKGANCYIIKKKLKEIIGK